MKQISLERTRNALPDPEIGTIWTVISRDHKGHRRKIVGKNAAGTMLHVMFVGHGSRQHRGKIYSVPKEPFLLYNRPSGDA